MANQTLTLSRVYESTSLAPISDVVAMLDREVSLEKVADFASKIEAARRYDSENTERRNYWGELAIWSSRRLGELIRLGQEKKLLASKGQPRKEMRHDDTLTAPATLPEVGIERKQSERAQRLADIPEAKISEYVEEQKKKGEEVSKAGLVRFATGTEKAGSHAHVSLNTGVPEWYTPSEYIEAARKVMQKITIDPASSAIAQQTVKADKFFTIDDNGLSKPWNGNVWLNPPYSSDLCPKFVEKLCSHIEAGDVTQAVLLVNNATETKWFQRAASTASAICLPAGRVKFLDDQGKPGAPLQGQAVVYFGKHSNLFSDAFSSFGVVLWKTKNAE